ncbi:ABC transporter substrate-binding protein [Paenibacillus swuensis]|uniref:ABC transporter substrate-binding protein n=1 Tax=Paenibacillus swuensis TaxID=1178515 RepID=UPI000839871B|nr:extracellular solute-binding protein [Paenibacillus swuensis]
MNKRRGSVRLGIQICISIIFLLLAGCTEAPEETGKGTLKILTYSQDSFDQMYENYFSIKFPDVEVEVIPISDNLEDPYAPVSNEQLKSKVERHRPDLLIIDERNYAKSSSMDLLYNLESWMAQDKVMHPDQFTPAAMDWARKFGGGDIYGLHPEFTTRVLFYNKTLFDRYDVPYPTDGMNWEDLILTAQRIVESQGDGDNIYGYHEMGIRNSAGLVNVISWSDRLLAYNYNLGKVTINTPAWNKAFTLATEAVRNGFFSNLKQTSTQIDGETYITKEDQENNDLFLKGKAAMTSEGMHLLERLEQKSPSFDWGIVTAPAGMSNPDMDTNYYPHPVMAIGANAENKELAWEVLKYFHGEEYAKVRSKLGTSNLSTRAGDKISKTGIALDTFYQRNQIHDKHELYVVDTHDEITREFYIAFDKLREEKTDLIITGKLTVDQALQAIQSEGQFLLDQAKKREKNTP